MTVLETDRLLMTRLSYDDCAFVVELVNEPSFKRFRGRGYASESAQAVLKHGFEDLGLSRIIAIADPENRPSVTLLQKLGFDYERKVRMPEDDHDINLYSLAA